MPIWWITATVAARMPVVSKSLGCGSRTRSPSVALRITTKMVKDYIAAGQAKGLASGTINREIATLRAMFIHGTKVTPPMVDRLPAFPTRLKESKPRKGFVNDTQYAALSKNAKSLWMRALIACYYNFGFRKGEML
jgi:hypothetical protein